MFTIQRGIKILCTYCVLCNVNLYNVWFLVCVHNNIYAPIYKREHNTDSYNDDDNTLENIWYVYMSARSKNKCLDNDKG